LNKGDKGSKSGGIIGKTLENFSLRRSRDGSAGFNGFLSLGKKQTGNNGSGVNIFGIRIGQEPKEDD